MPQTIPADGQVNYPNVPVTCVIGPWRLCELLLLRTFGSAGENSDGEDLVRIQFCRFDRVFHRRIWGRRQPSPSCPAGAGQGPAFSLQNNGKPATTALRALRGLFPHFPLTDREVRELVTFR
jgi:hypothetical protein